MHAFIGWVGCRRLFCNRPDIKVLHAIIIETGICGMGVIKELVEVLWMA